MLALLGARVVEIMQLRKYVPAILKKKKKNRLHKIGRAESSSSRALGETYQDFSHVLLTCQHYSQQRRELRVKLRAMGLGMRSYWGRRGWKIPNYPPLLSLF